MQYQERTDVRARHIHQSLRERRRLFFFFRWKDSPLWQGNNNLRAVMYCKSSRTAALIESNRARLWGGPGGHEMTARIHMMQFLFFFLLSFFALALISVSVDDQRRVIAVSAPWASCALFTASSSRLGILDVKGFYRSLSLLSVGISMDGRTWQGGARRGEAKKINPVTFTDLWLLASA